MDLRWQRADKKVGFYGLKEGVKLRSEDPNFKIEWDSFDSVDRQKKAHADLMQKVNRPFYRQFQFVDSVVYLSGYSTAFVQFAIRKNDFDVNRMKKISMNSTQRFPDRG